MRPRCAAARHLSSAPHRVRVRFPRTPRFSPPASAAMTLESFLYTINLAIGAILATLLMQHYRRAGRESSIAYWTLTAWLMTLASLLFAARPVLPYWFGRFVPTLMITVAHGVLLLGAERTAERPRRTAAVAAVIGVHAALLLVFLATTAFAPWRSVINGLVWSALSIAAFLVLRGTGGRLRAVMATPAVVFLAHGLFHVVRLSVAAAVALGLTTDAGGVLQRVGDVEASIFMVALFVSLLAAHLQLRNEELLAARRDVRELSELFPVCAWCRKMKTGDGYWQQIEAWLAENREMRFTHSMCESCEREQLAQAVEPPRVAQG